MEESINLSEWAASVEAACKRIRPHLSSPSPLLHSQQLSAELDCDVWLKLDNCLPAGSFKIRGSFNRILARLGNANNREQQDQIRFVTASSGNHGLACCYVLHRLGLTTPGVVYLPSSVPPSKEAAIRAYESSIVEVRKVGLETHESELAARQWAAEEEGNRVFVSPYNDAVLIAGQGVCGKEIIDQWLTLGQPSPSPDAVFVSVGGGGLIGGSGAYLKHHDARIQLVGCQPINDAVMHHSILAGRILTYNEAGSQPTISHGTAGGVDMDSVTFGLCKRVIDSWQLATESGIAKGAIDTHRVCHEEFGLSCSVEPAAGLPLAALRRQRTEGRLAKGARLVLVVCGGNVGGEEWSEVCRVAGHLEAAKP